MSERETIEDQKDEEVRVKVTDRRKFDSQGQRRSDEPLEEESEASSAPAAEPDPGPAAVPGPTTPEPEPTASAAESPSPAAPAGQNQDAGEAPRAVAGEDEAASQVDFQSFVYFLYMSALHELGVPTQEGGESRPADLERARFFVEVLRLLEVKTKGNLEPGETKLLEEALYNLRMQYVGISQKSPS
jgi:hypothetical protein